MLDPFSDRSKIDMYYCLQCSHQTASVFQLDHHIRRSHKIVYAAELFHAIGEPEQFSCIKCDYRNYHRFELYEHYKQAHDNLKTENEKNQSFFGKVARYSCECCNFKSNSCLFFTRHRVLCKKGRDGFKCNQCSYRTEQKSRLKRHHMLKHATDEEIKWFRCNICSYRAKQKWDLKVHMLKHVPDEDINWFQCNDCSYRTKIESYLKTHMLRHADETNCLKCDHCSYRATKKSYLKRHMLKHATNENVDGEKYFADRETFC